MLYRENRGYVLGLVLWILWRGWQILGGESMIKLKCFPFHSWGKWYQYQITHRYSVNHRDIEKRQKRTCAVCGKEKDEMVAYL